MTQPPLQGYEARTKGRKYGDTHLALRAYLGKVSAVSPFSSSTTQDVCSHIGQSFQHVLGKDMAALPCRARLASAEQRMHVVPVDRFRLVPTTILVQYTDTH